MPGVKFAFIVALGFFGIWLFESGHHFLGWLAIIVELVIWLTLFQEEA